MEVKVLTIREDILGANKEKGRRNQEQLDEHGILAVNVMSSPGAGKTSLILETIRRLCRPSAIMGHIPHRLC